MYAISTMSKAFNITSLPPLPKALGGRVRRGDMRRQAGKKVPVSKRTAAGSGKGLLIVTLLQSCGLTFVQAREAEWRVKIWKDKVW